MIWQIIRCVAILYNRTRSIKDFLRSWRLKSRSDGNATQLNARRYALLRVVNECNFCQICARKQLTIKQCAWLDYYDANIAWRFGSYFCKKTFICHFLAMPFSVEILWNCGAVKFEGSIHVFWILWTGPNLKARIRDKSMAMKRYTNLR